MVKGPAKMPVRIELIGKKDLRVTAIHKVLRKSLRYFVSGVFVIKEKHIKV